MAQQYLAENCLQSAIVNAQGQPLRQRLDSSLINTSQEGIIYNSLNLLNDVTGRNGKLDFVSIPFVNRGQFRINESNLFLECFGDNPKVTFDNLLIDGPLNMVTACNCETLNNKKTDVSVASLIFPEVVQLVQGSTNQLTKNKLVFNYPFQAGVPAEIKFESELLANGMVFVKDTRGINNIPGITLTLDFPPPPPAPARPPVLTISGLPNIGGFSSAMLYII